MSGVPRAAVDLAKRFEGFHRVPQSDPNRAHPYVCPDGIWTIGYGHLCNPTYPPISVAEGEAYLARDLVTALDATLRFCPALATEPSSMAMSCLSSTEALTRRCTQGRMARVRGAQGAVLSRTNPADPSRQYHGGLFIER